MSKCYIKLNNMSKCYTKLNNILNKKSREDDFNTFKKFNLKIKKINWYDHYYEIPPLNT